uniref:ERAD-associated E3 ubiquitin-protein ligase component HRD3A n=1 Tax=Noccaea caerulescens TaxID=107243 RepID=A0A1J3H365_NOCCA
MMQVQVLDSLPKVYPKVEEWVENVVLEEGNATILTLILCLITVLYLRGRRRGQVVLDPVGADVAQPIAAGPVAFPH